MTIEDLPADQVGPLFTNARRLATAVREAMDAQGTFVAMNNVVSQSVPHLHVHIVPRVRKDGLRGFFWPRHKYRRRRDGEVGGGDPRGALAARRHPVDVEDLLDLAQAGDRSLELVGVSDLDDEAVLDHRVLGRAAGLEDVHARLGEGPR